MGYGTKLITSCATINKKGVGTTMDAILAALGLTKGSVIGGFLGALISLKFIEGLNFWQRLTTVFAEMIVAAYSTPIAVELLELKPSTEGGVAFLIGLFGMSLVSAVIAAMPGIVEAVKGRINR